MKNFLRVLDYVFTGNTRDELFVKIGIQLAVEVVIDAILGETLAVLAVQKVRLLTVFQILAVLVPKTFRIMIMVTAARLVKFVLRYF